MSSSHGWPEGLKKTKQRSLVYQVLEKSTAPVTAMEILAVLEQAGTPVWLSTIYRVLDTFAEQDLVRKTDGLDGGMAMFELSLRGHKHYAVCMECRKVTPLEGCPFEACSPRLPKEEGDFQITGHNLQVYGYCGRCSNRREKKESSQ